MMVSCSADRMRGSLTWARRWASSKENTRSAAPSRSEGVSARAKAPESSRRAAANNGIGLDLKRPGEMFQLLLGGLKLDEQAVGGGAVLKLLDGGLQPSR